MEIIENNRKPGCHLMIIGNKTDLEDQRAVEKNISQTVIDDIKNDIKLKFSEDVHSTEN